MHQPGDWCKLGVSCVIITDIAPVVTNLSSSILGSSLFSSRCTEMEARQGAAWPSAQPYRCRWFPIASARHRVCPRCSRRREELRNKHVALKHQRPPNAIMMSLIAARRQGKETEKVPPANIDSRYVSFGEHAAVRAPLSSPNC
ncbi:hypothetical protein HDV63DRAFT_384860 [Trichoderma sp. SZMC 28014]